MKIGRANKKITRINGTIKKSPSHSKKKSWRVNKSSITNSWRVCFSYQTRVCLVCNLLSVVWLMICYQNLTYFVHLMQPNHKLWTSAACCLKMKNIIIYSEQLTCLEMEKNCFYCEHLTCSLMVAVSEELPQGSTLAESAEKGLMLFHKPHICHGYHGL